MAKMVITKSNATPASQRLAYYVEFTFNERPYNCEFYRDGSRQIFAILPYPLGSRRFKGSPQMNEVMDKIAQENYL